MNSTTPLVCNMNVFTPDERESHIQTTLQLFHSVKEAHEVENGYEFIFPKETELAQLADFIDKEKMCCPFLKFTLQVESEIPITLLLTGPIGTQEFLREEFSEVFI